MAAMRMRATTTTTCSLPDETAANTKKAADGDAGADTDGGDDAG